jgi:dihydroflavonol-4-reductase
VHAAVTGATGLLGGHVVRALCAGGAAVRVLVRPGADLRGLAGLDVERVVGDLDSPQALHALVSGVDLVVHAAAAVWVGRTRVAELERVNVAGTAAVCAAARAGGVRRLVHVSSVDALGIGSWDAPGDEDTPPNLGHLGCAYVDTKRRAEAEVLAAVAGGLDAVIVNPAYLLGPWDIRPTSGRMLLAIGAGRAILAPGGGNCFVDVRSVARGVLVAGARGVTGRRYVLGGENLTYLDAWRRFAALLGVRGPVGVVPHGLSRWAGAMGQLWTAAGRPEPEINPMTVAMGELPHYFSSRRAEEELGWVADPLDDAVRDAWTWFRAQGYA